MSNLLPEREQVRPADFLNAEGAEDWRVVGDGCTAFYPTGSFSESLRLVEAIGRLPGIDEHPPAIDMRADGVTFRVVTVFDNYMGPSVRDLELARAISVAARGLGLKADPSAAQSLIVIPGASNIAEITPFWRAILGYVPRPDSPDEDLVDPHDRGTGFWFEGMQEPRADGLGAIHIAVWLPIEQAEARVAAALAAGGRMVRDDYAPAWWTLADAAGNEADISTIATRE
jgi:4a-hydroxytetrahydrobiopterin dehydratase